MAAMALTACDDLFQPAIENNQEIASMYKDADLARGLLDNAYLALPYDASPSTDVATDDAVSNDASNNYKKMAMGDWSSNMNPVSQWDGRFHAIQYCNILIREAANVPWSGEKAVNELFIQNYLGNAYALRGLHHFYALRAHAGAATQGGEILGIPMHLEYIDENADYNESRRTFKECYDLIMADWKKAMEYLPDSYGSVDDAANIPAKYQKIAENNTTNYNKAFGNQHRGKIDGNVIRAFKAQLALLAASPAYASAKAATYEEAAALAAECMATKGGLETIQADGWHIYEDNKFLNNIGAEDPNTAEMIWRANVNKTQSYEKDNYPPSLNGTGRVNPTQNLVDAFPMANGYPIADSRSGYNAQDPYADRDPRLAAYIVFNGQKLGSSNGEIITEADAMDPNDPTKLNHDGFAHETGKSTLTGYYMRKLLRNDVNCNGGSDENHLQIRIRATEILLAYAEAANQQAGPTAKVGGAGYSALDVIVALRLRAGVGTEYVEEIAKKGDKEAFAKIIQNERRIELCFENSRFWDLRRWMLPLNETAKGMKITTENGVKKYQIVDVEKRDYKDYMYYCPIPYGECIKWSNLQQNYGW